MTTREIITSRWATVVYGIILSLAMTLQETALGGSWLSAGMGVATAAAFGLMAETIRYAMKHGGWNIVNVLPWIGGGIVGGLLAVII